MTHVGERTRVSNSHTSPAPVKIYECVCVGLRL
jgi:hypothetical protein